MTTKFVQYGKLRYRISKSKDGRSRLEIVKRGIIDITEIIGLNQLHDLDELDLSKNKISDITGLENLTNLKVLDLSYNAIADPQTMKKLKENHLNLKDIYLRGNPCFDSMEDIKIEVRKLNPSKTSIISVFSDWIDDKDPQFPMDASVSDFVGEILKVEPEFFLRFLYNNISEILEKKYGVERRNLIEKNIIEKCCLYEGEQILYEFQGDIKQIDDVQNNIYVTVRGGNIYVTNYRIIAQGELETKGHSSNAWIWGGFYIWLLSGGSKRAKSKEGIIDRSAEQELPCYGYQFKIKNHQSLKKKSNSVRYIVYSDNVQNMSGASTFKQHKTLMKAMKIITLKPPKEQIDELFKILSKDVNDIKDTIKVLLEMELKDRLKKQVIIDFLLNLRVSEEYQYLSNSEYVDIVEATYKLNPQFFVKSIYNKMRDWRFPSLNLKEENILKEEIRNRIDTLIRESAISDGSPSN